MMAIMKIGTKKHWINYWQPLIIHFFCDENYRELLLNNELIAELLRLSNA